jgi:hypothetical protein
MRSTVPATAPDAAVAVVNGLQYELRRRRLIAFGGRGRARGVRAKFEVRADSGPFGARSKKPPKDTLVAGGDGRVHITNTGSAPFHPYLIEVANDGTVNILYPNVAEHAASQAIQPGKATAPGAILITAGALPGDQQYVLIASKTPIDDIDQLAFSPAPFGACQHHPPATRGGRSRKGSGAPWALVTKTIKVVPGS